jgi:hypothetical protein
MEAGWYHVAANGASGGGVDFGVARPRPPAPFRDDSPYGVVAPPHVEKEWPLLAEMGAAWLQWSATWAYMEMQPGLYWYKPNAPKQYGDPEGYIKNSNKHGIRTVIQFRSTPTWASKGSIGSYKDSGQAKSVMFPPDDDHLDDFEKFIGEIVKQFKPLGVHHYELWSEAQGSLFKGWETPRYPKVEAYQKLLQRARKAIKANDPSGQLIGAGDDSMEFLRDIESGHTAPEKHNSRPSDYAGRRLSGIGQAVDIVSGHFYWTDWVSRPRTHWGPEQSNPGRRPNTLKDMIADAKEIAGSRPLWITEVGYGSAPSSETPDEIAGSENDQANLLVRYFLLSRAWGAKKTFWYTWKDRKAADGKLATSYGLLRDDGTVKPAYTAYRTMTERLEGLNTLKLTESGPNRWIVHLSSGPRTVVVVWKLKADGRPETLTLPWKKVRVTRRDGSTSALEAEGGKVKVELRSGEPVYLDDAN